ncbi:GNAT family N-acetyltransferase [Sandaracinus amylolyticus]|uniref:GNAT family N-acetyltransferase n=1 Tax=Sandaracinus amylolyticus TaxID=927083 RepID=UPI00069D67B0|nr:GNAT family N-acetyltransferase [Sandaracinus amylolyticus]
MSAAHPREAFRIEPVTHDDRDDAVRLLVAQLREHHIDTPEERVRVAVDGVLGVPSRGRLLLVHDDEKAIGVAYLSFVWALEHGGPAAWLEELYVVPERRNDGVGTALLHAAMGVARIEGCVAIDLEVEASRARVTSLYRREGFTQHARTRWVKTL